MIAPIPRREAHIAAIITPVPGFELPVGVVSEELVPLGPPLEVDDGEPEEDADGTKDTDAGELDDRQVLSFEMPTVFTSELPPCLPRESVMINTMDVPAATSASQSKEAGPVGGWITNVWPPGITP